MENSTPRPVNANTPVPRPREEMCDLSLEELQEFWLLVFRDVGRDFKSMRVQSQTIYRNGRDS